VKAVVTPLLARYAGGVSINAAKNLFFDAGAERGAAWWRQSR